MSGLQKAVGLVRERGEESIGIRMIDQLGIHVMYVFLVKRENKDRTAGKVDRYCTSAGVISVFSSYLNFNIPDAILSYTMPCLAGGKVRLRNY